MPGPVRKRTRPLPRDSSSSSSSESESSEDERGGSKRPKTQVNIQPQYDHLDQPKVQGERIWQLEDVGFKIISMII